MGHRPARPGFIGRPGWDRCNTLAAGHIRPTRPVDEPRVGRPSGRGSPWAIDESCASPADSGRPELLLKGCAQVAVCASIESSVQSGRQPATAHRILARAERDVRSAGRQRRATRCNTTRCAVVPARSQRSRSRGAWRVAKHARYQSPVGSTRRLAITALARMFNPIIRGWLTYYGRYYPSGLYPTLQYLDRRLARWAEGKYKRLRRHRRRSEHRIRAIAACDPGLFAHWRLLHRAAAGR